MAKEKGSRLIANNKKAYHDYFIEETYEAGIALRGRGVGGGGVGGRRVEGKVQYQGIFCEN